MLATIAPVTALLIGASILLLGNGVQSLLLPIRASDEAFSTMVIGLMGAAYPAGFILSCLSTPQLVQRVGHIRTFAVLAAIAGVSALAHAVLVVPLAWVVLRLISGFCFAGLFMVIESWLNEAASNTTRGQIFSTYMVVNLASVTAGQLLIGLGDPGDFRLFALAASAIILSLVPVGLTTSKGPPPIEVVQLRLGRLYRMSPVGVLGCFFVGVANGSFGSLGPIFAGAAGLSVGEIALFMSAGLIGGAVFQMPIGRLSDRMDRRRVIVAASLVAVLLGVTMMLVGDARAGGRLLAFDAGAIELPQGALIALAFFFGAAIHPIYGLCTAHTNDFVERAEFVEASSGLLLTWGLGAATGPLLASVLMEIAGPGSLFLFTAAAHLACALFALWRISRRTAPRPDERDVFVPANAAARTTPVATVLDPRSELMPEADSISPATASGEPARQPGPS
ncbi:MAG: MFS transporter [Geminicoccaceae bacterium]|nr:MFS transporter [Geminicoccaceae bacterium]